MDVSRLCPDVSLYDAYNLQGQLVTLDWLSTGYPLAIIKCSQAKFKDPAFYAQWKAAEVLSNRVAYHFFDATVNAIQQAQYCWSVIRDVFTDKDYLAIDYEYLANRTYANTTSLLALSSMLYELEKVVPLDHLMIYTGASFWYTAGGKTALWAKKYKLWQAQWPWDNWLFGIQLPPYLWSEKLLVEKTALIANGLAKPVQCLPWDKASIWQFTARMDPKLIPSYTANKKAVDLNYIYMDLGTQPQYKVCPTCNGTGKIPV